MGHDFWGEIKDLKSWGWKFEGILKFEGQEI